MFRDESSHVIKKAKAKQRKKVNLSPDSESSPESDSFFSFSTPTPTPSVTPEPRATTTTTTTTTTTITTTGGKAGRLLRVLTPTSTLTVAGMSPHRIQDDDENQLPSPDAGSWPSTPMIALVYNIAPTFQERGTAYFFSRYVTIDENCCHQRFDFVYDVWKPHSMVPERQLDGVMASMTAVGLVGVANLTRSTDIMDGARKSYGTALRLTNAALRNPREATKDETMLAILILGLFEMMTDPSAKSMKAWHEHVNGAAALAKMRGQTQFRSKAGIRMFMMLCQVVMITCVQKEMPMPPVLVNLRNELATMFKKSEPGIEISRPIYQVLQARYDIKNGKLANSDEMLDRLNAIEDEFESVIATFPDQWGYKVFRTAKPHPAVYRDVCHLYPSIWLATIWNGLRSCRMLILESIVSGLHERFHNVDPELIAPRYLDEFQKARAKLAAIMDAILASAPQHFSLLNPLSGYLDTLLPISTTEVRDLPTPPADSPESTSSADDWSPDELETDDSGPTLMDPTRAKSEDEAGKRFMLLASSTNTIVWPLYSVGMSSSCTPAMKAYVVERLMALYHETGLTQAKTVAGIVKNREVRPSQLMSLPVRQHQSPLVGKRAWVVYPV